MTSAALALRRLPRPGADPDARPSLARLTGVELRKMADTRAGFWLLAAIGLGTVAAAVLMAALAEPAHQTLRGMLEVVVLPTAILLPVAGVLLVTAEWGQRTALATFALVPVRGRVLAAKAAAASLASVAAAALCLAAAAAGTAAAAPGVEGAWSLPAAQVGQLALYAVTGTLVGVGFGAVLLASAPAIVALFAVPITWGVVSAVAGIEDVARWADVDRGLAPLLEGPMSAVEWARAGTTLLVWMALPLAAGAWRISRAEIR
ncbi:MAG: ABC transporter permease [Solirubrobacteraceae bacterium]|nr:ABC transporter permease [Solirubrobacteraceae bacterium]